MRAATTSIRYPSHLRCRRQGSSLSDSLGFVIDLTSGGVVSCLVCRSLRVVSIPIVSPGWPWLARSKTKNPKERSNSAATCRASDDLSSRDRKDLKSISRPSSPSVRVTVGGASCGPSIWRSRYRVNPVRSSPVRGWLGCGGPPARVLLTDLPVLLKFRDGLRDRSWERKDRAGQVR